MRRKSIDEQLVEAERNDRLANQGSTAQAENFNLVSVGPIQKLIDPDTFEPQIRFEVRINLFSMVCDGHPNPEQYLLEALTALGEEIVAQLLEKIK